MKFYFKATIVVLIFVFALFSFSLNHVNLYDIDDSVVVYSEDLNSYIATFPINTHIEKKTESKYTLRYKFLDLFTIKKIEANILKNVAVYLGGEPLGVNIGADGLIITGFQELISNKGVVSPYQESDLTIGDIIVKVNDKRVKTTQELVNEVNKSNGKTLPIVAKRGDNMISTSITPALDSLTHEYRIGVFVKDGIQGIGTLTYVKMGDLRYGALGHSVGSIEPNNESMGSINKCRIYGSKAGVRGKPGELKGVFNPDRTIGTIDKNNKFGIYGTYNGDIKSLKTIEIGGRETTHMGEASIFCTIDEKGVQEFSVELIKTEYQSSEREKGIVIKITDDRLKNITGGIVQGMSGSPIVQDGRLVGAVSHVFINDPTRGYGVYIDWMLQN